MNNRTHEPAPGPNETIERREVIERRDHGVPAEPARRGNSNLIWLLPLLLVVIGLVWYIFAQGTPINPRESLDVRVNVPEVELPRVQEERNIRIEVPQPAGDPQPQPQPPRQ